MAAGNSTQTLTINIAGQNNGSLNNAVNAAKKALNGLSGGAFNLVSRAAKVGFTAVTAAVGAASTAVGAFVKSSVDAGMQFDTAMSQVAATMGVTTDQIGGLRQLALDMGAKTAFSATQAAEALNYMALAGYDAETSTKMLPNVLNLAAAGNIELALASDMVTDAQTALGLSIDQTTVLVDQMAKASSKSNTSVAQLGEAILTVGGTAQYMSGGTQEIATVLGVLADNSIKGAEGGTHLRNILLSLSSPTTNAQKVLKDLGVSAFDAEGKMRSFADFFPELNAAMANMTDQQKLETLSTLFNARDIASATALLETSKDRWTELGGAIGDAAGAAEDMAATQLDNLQGDVTLFKSALEGAQIALSDKLTPQLREFVQLGSQGLTKVTEAFKAGDFQGAMTAMGEFFNQAIQMAMNAAPKLIEAGTTLLESLIDGFLKDDTKLTSSVTKVVVKLGEAFIKIAPKLIVAGGKLLAGLVKGLIENLPAIGEAARQACEYFITAISNGLNSTDPIKQAVTRIGLILAGILGGLLAFRAVSGIVGHLKTFFNIFKGAGQAASAAQNVGGAMNQMSAGAKNFVAYGAGIAAAAAGIWLLADAAIKIANAGAPAQIAMSLMTGALAGLMAIAAAVGPALQGSATGFLAFGAAVAMCAASMLIIATAAQQIGSAGTGAQIAMVAMTAGIAGLMAVAGAVGPALTAGAVGLVAFGAAVLLAGTGMLVLVQAATQIAAAGPAAGIALAAMMAGVVAMGAACGALAPLLLAGAAGLGAFGAALLVVGGALNLIVAAAQGSVTALERLCQLAPTLAAAAPSVGSALTAMVGPLTAFAGACAAAGAAGLGGGAGIAAVGAAALLAQGSIVPLGNAMSWIATAIDNLANKSTAAITGLNNVKAAFTSAIPEIDHASMAFKNFSAAAEQACNQTLNTVRNCMTGITNAIRSVNLADAGKNMMQGLIDGINSMKEQVINAAKQIAQAASNAVNTALKVKSPSRVMIETGAYVAEGLAIGMESGTGIAQNAAAGLATSAIQGTQTAGDDWIGKSLNTLQGGGGDTYNDNSQQPVQISYSPNYTFTGGAPNKQDLVEAERMSQGEFEKMASQWLRNMNRINFKGAPI